MLSSHFKCQLPDQPADPDNFQLLLTEKQGLEKVTKRQKAIPLSLQAVNFKQKKLQIGLVKNSVLFLGPKYIIISTCP